MANRRAPKRNILNFNTDFSNNVSKYIAKKETRTFERQPTDSVQVRFGKSNIINVKLFMPEININWTHPYKKYKVVAAFLSDSTGILYPVYTTQKMACEKHIMETG